MASFDTAHFTDRDIKRFWLKVDKSEGCWNWLGNKFKDGCGSFGVRHKYWRTSRLSYILQHGHIQDNLLVCHTCDNPGCVNPDHLFLGTNEDNAKDKVSKSRQSCLHGTSNGRAKISHTQVEEIRKLYKSGNSSAKSIGALFGIGASQTLRIIHHQQRVEEGIHYGRI